MKKEKLAEYLKNGLEMIEKGETSDNIKDYLENVVQEIKTITDKEKEEYSDSLKIEKEEYLEYKKHFDEMNDKRNFGDYSKEKFYRDIEEVQSDILQEIVQNHLKVIPNKEKPYEILFKIDDNISFNNKGIWDYTLSETLNENVLYSVMVKREVNPYQVYERYGMEDVLPQFHIYEKGELLYDSKSDDNDIEKIKDTIINLKGEEYWNNMNIKNAKDWEEIKDGNDFNMFYNKNVVSYTNYENIDFYEMRVAENEFTGNFRIYDDKKIIYDNESLNNDFENIKEIIEDSLGKSYLDKMDFNNIKDWKEVAQKNKFDIMCKGKENNFSVYDNFDYYTDGYEDFFYNEESSKDMEFITEKLRLDLKENTTENIISEENLLKLGKEYNCLDVVEKVINKLEEREKPIEIKRDKKIEIEKKQELGKEL